MDRDSLAMTAPDGTAGAFNTRVMGWTSSGLLVFISAFIWAPSRDGLEAIYALAFFIPMLGVLLLRKPDTRSYGGWPNFIALAYAAFCVLSSLWGEAKDISFFILQWCVLAVWLCGVSWLHSCRPINYDRLYQLLVVLGAIVALSVVAEFYWQHPFSARLEAWTVARNPIVVAQVFGVVALLAFILSWQATNKIHAALFFLCAICALLPLGLSQSRGPLLAFIAIFFVALVCIAPRRTVWLAQLGVLILITVVATLLFNVEAIIAMRGISLSLRDVVWLEIFELSRANPWFGIGLAKDTFIVVKGIAEFHHAHNPWVDTFYRTGVVGLGLAVAHFALIMRGFKRNSPLLPLYLWLLFGVFCLLSDGRLLFWEIDAKWFLYWIPTGLLAAALIKQQPDAATASKKSGS